MKRTLRFIAGAALFTISALLILGIGEALAAGPALGVDRRAYGVACAAAMFSGVLGVALGAALALSAAFHR